MPTFADTKNADGNRSARSAAIGPATVQGFSKDMESQGALARSGRGVVAGTTILDAQTNADDLDADLGPDDVETHMSVFTFLKIVSPCAEICLYNAHVPGYILLRRSALLMMMMGQIGGQPRLTHVCMCDYLR